MNIGKQIKELRVAKKLKAIELAKAAHISQPYLSDIESNRTKPSLDTLESICKVLDISLPQIFVENSDSLPPDLLQLIEIAKTLTAEQRVKLNELLKALQI